MEKILHLKKRRDFIRVADGIRMVVSTVILQAAPSLSINPVPFKVGFTTTKKIGRAVVRTRVRRRLRAVVREVFPSLAKDNVEYVLIGRYNTVSCPYKTLKSDIKWALKKANEMIENGIYKSPSPAPKSTTEENEKNTD
ncbi:MAG: ribonuclease P protein component [Alphaproteobacteria bacterium]|nr:ribonuclease P protein component [Alphaproteobacteria bacterium]